MTPVRRLLVPALLAALLGLAPAAHAEPTPPVKLAYVEGDIGGTQMIWSVDGKRVIGLIEYRQLRKKDVLVISRTAHFKDGSSDSDEAEVRVGDRLESIRGRMTIRDRKGKPTLDFTIDVAAKRVTGFYTEDGKRHEVDDEFDIGPGTYWGPLFAIVLKNFAANADGDALVFSTITATPKPRALDMRFTRAGAAKITRTGGAVATTRFTLLPTVNFLIDPILKRFVPETNFYVDGEKPPTIVRFVGPRNYAGQIMRLD
jgi:hypothetical protein